MSEFIKIAVLSDAHGNLLPEVMKQIEDCKYVLYAGDACQRSVLDQLCAKHFLYAVQGNCDTSWAKNLARTLRFTLGDITFFLTHQKKDVPWNLTGIDIVITGHTHHYEEKRTENCLWLNPGSCGSSRFGQPLTMAKITLNDKNIAVEKIILK